jgi:hypothetical protein
MLNVGGTIHLSATDLVGHLYCHYLTDLDLQVAKGAVAKPKIWDPVLEVLAERGAQHEKSYIDHLQASGLTERINTVLVSIVRSLKLTPCSIGTLTPEKKRTVFRIDMNGQTQKSLPLPLHLPQRLEQRFRPVEFLQNVGIVFKFGELGPRQIFHGLNRSPVPRPNLSFRRWARGVASLYPDRLHRKGNPRARQDRAGSFIHGKSVLKTKYLLNLPVTLCILAVRLTFLHLVCSERQGHDCGR